MGSRVVEAEYEKGMLKPSAPLTLRPGERVHLIVMRQPDPKRWDLSRLAQSPAADEAVLAEQERKRCQRDREKKVREKGVRYLFSERMY